MNKINNKIAFFIGSYSKIIMSAIFLFLLAIFLGPKEFGFYVFVIAFLSVLIPFSGLGYGNIMIRDGVTSKDKIESLLIKAHKVLVITSVTLAVIATIIICILSQDLKAFYIIILLSFVELYFFRYFELSSQYYIAQDRMDIAGVIYFISSIIKPCSLLIFLVDSHTNLTKWVLFYFSVTLAIGIFLHFFSTKVIWKHSMQVKNERLFSDFKESIYFSIGLSSQSIYNESDKVIIGSSGYMEFNGNYGLAYKIVDMIFLPCKTVLSYTYRKFFLYSEDKKKLKDLKNKLILAFVLYGSIAWISSYFIMDNFSFLIPNQYQLIKPILLLLLAIIILRGISYPLADTLTGIGLQKSRSIIQLVTAIINILLSVLAITFISPYYVIYVSILCDFILCIGLYILVRRKI